MPNGGTDNCGTCCFNRRNEGRTGHGRGNPELPNHCHIRDQPIDDPGYTYCLNHPYRIGERDPIPIGPILVAEVGPGFSYGRVPWKPSPDSEAVRVHLLELLAQAEALFENDFHPSFGPKVRHYPDFAGVVIWQLGQFRERRAVAGIEAALANIPELESLARGALDAIGS